MKGIKSNSFRAKKLLPIVDHILNHKAFQAFLGVIRSEQLKWVRKEILKTQFTDLMEPGAV